MELARGDQGLLPLVKEEGRMKGNKGTGTGEGGAPAHHPDTNPTPKTQTTTTMVEGARRIPRPLPPVSLNPPSFPLGSQTPS